MVVVVSECDKGAGMMYDGEISDRLFSLSWLSIAEDGM